MQINEVGTLKIEWQAMLVMKKAYLLLKDHQPLSFIASENNSFFLRKPDIKIFARNLPSFQC